MVLTANERIPTLPGRDELEVPVAGLDILVALCGGDEYHLVPRMKVMSKVRLVTRVALLLDDTHAHTSEVGLVEWSSTHGKLLFVRFF
jgi:hypothetical protein